MDPAENIVVIMGVIEDVCKYEEVSNTIRIMIMMVIMIDDFNDDDYDNDNDNDNDDDDW